MFNWHSKKYGLWCNLKFFMLYCNTIMTEDRCCDSGMIYSVSKSGSGYDYSQSKRRINQGVTFKGTLNWTFLNNSRKERNKIEIISLLFNFCWIRIGNKLISDQENSSGSDRIRIHNTAWDWFYLVTFLKGSQCNQHMLHFSTTHTGKKLCF